MSLITSKCVTKYLEERILILSSLAQKLQLKKFDDFWPPGAKSFPMVYNMNDFVEIIFGRYYTLRGKDLSFLGNVSSFISFIVRR